MAVIKNESTKPLVLSLVAGLKQTQLVTSVLVAYELYRGVHPNSRTRKSQLTQLNLALSRFALKPVYEAHTMQAAKNFQWSAGDIDPILAARCVDGNFVRVTFNQIRFAKMQGIETDGF